MRFPSGGRGEPRRTYRCRRAVGSMGDGVARRLAFGRIRGGCQPAGAGPRRMGARARARWCSCAHLPEHPRLRLLVGALVFTGCARWKSRRQAGVRLGAGHGFDRFLVWDHRARMDCRDGHCPRRCRLPLPSWDAMAGGWDWGGEGLSRCCLFASRERRRGRRCGPLLLNLYSL